MLLQVLLDVIAVLSQLPSVDASRTNVLFKAGLIFVLTHYIYLVKMESSEHVSTCFSIHYCTETMLHVKDVFSEYLLWSLPSNSVEERLQRQFESHEAVKMWACGLQFSKVPSNSVAEHLQRQIEFHEAVKKSLRYNYWAEQGVFLQPWDDDDERLFFVSLDPFQTAYKTSNAAARGVDPVLQVNLKGCEDDDDENIFMSKVASLPENPDTSQDFCGIEEKLGNLTQFISDCKEDVKCPVCLNIIIDPVITECEHQFCDFCIEKWLNFNKKACPTCRHNIKIPVIKNRNLARWIDLFYQNVMDEDVRTTRNKKIEERKWEVQVYKKSAGG